MREGLSLALYCVVCLCCCFNILFSKLALMGQSGDNEEKRRWLLSWVADKMELTNCAEFYGNSGIYVVLTIYYGLQSTVGTSVKDWLTGTKQLTTHQPSSISTRDFLFTGIFY